MLHEPITLSCSNGFTLYAKDGAITISTRKSDEVIPVSKIQSVTIKDPGALSPGKFTFTTSQAPSAGIGLGFGVTAVLGGEKSFFFSKNEALFASYMRDYILNYEKEKQAEIDEKKRQDELKRRREENARLEQQRKQEEQAQKEQNVKQVVSVIDEIRGLKELLDEGILTEEEFSFKKRQLLGM